MLQGIFTPLPTPLTDDGTSISEIRLARLLQKLKENGFPGWVANSEVGEFNAFSYTDRKWLAELVLRMSAGSPVIVNVTSLSTSSSLDLAQHAERHGAVAVILGLPYWGPFFDDEIYLHFKTVAQYAHLPLIVVDPRKMISDEMKDTLSKLSNVKVAQPNNWMVEAFGTAAKERSEDFFEDDLCVTPLTLFKPVEQIATRSPSLQPMVKFMVKHGSAKVAKAAFELAGLDLGPLRAPALPLTGQTLSELKQLL